MDKGITTGIKECITCQNKKCETSFRGELFFCPYGVACYNLDGRILKARERVAKVDLAANMRHELSRILQFIVNQADEIDSTVSTRKIDLSNPASRIVGAVTILDQFVEMICGAHYFHQAKSTKSFARTEPLIDVVKKYIDIYSLIKNTRRAKNLNIRIDVDKGIELHKQVAILENIIAIYCDNIWKYADPSEPVVIQALKRTSEKIDLSFSNLGKRIPQGANPFEVGYQLDNKSEGFGYGLYWAEILAYQYNEEFNRRESAGGLRLEYRAEEIDGSDLMKHSFSINNILVGYPREN